jgi:peptidoglycan DL-endopeptidase CwlO
VAATLLRRIGAACTVLVTASVIAVIGVSGPAAADPEGGSKTLRDQLESAAKGYSDAKIKLAASQTRQKQLQVTMAAAQAGAKTLAAQIQVIADRSYRYGRFTTASLLLDSTEPSDFLERVYRLDSMAQLDARTMADYRRDVDLATTAKAAIDAEVRKQAAELTGGFVSADSPLAKPAPRNPDGSWPKESCTVDDPTTTGCITPRLLNAYQQARAAGFTHYTSCFSKRDSGEHPLGRACDFSAHATGFANVAATGADKAYGDRLAAFFIKNADRLGVMYVIWYRQIWMPSTGWRAYSATGAPNVVHTNHVHLSVL